MKVFLRVVVVTKPRACSKMWSHTGVPFSASPPVPSPTCLFGLPGPEASQWVGLGPIFLGPGILFPLGVWRSCTVRFPRGVLHSGGAAVVLAIRKLLWFLAMAVSLTDHILWMLGIDSHFWKRQDRKQIYSTAVLTQPSQITSRNFGKTNTDHLYK